MRARTRAQRGEVLGADNRWFCSHCTGWPVDDEETLWRHFCRNGGAADFDHRWKQATSDANRYYCSKHFGYEVLDEEMLWDYYTEHCDDHTRPRSAEPSLSR